MAAWRAVLRACGARAGAHCFSRRDRGSAALAQGAGATDMKLHPQDCSPPLNNTKKWRSCSTACAGPARGGVCAQYSKLSPQARGRPKAAGSARGPSESIVPPLYKKAKFWPRGPPGRSGGFWGLRSGLGPGDQAAPMARLPPSESIVPPVYNKAKFWPRGAPGRSGGFWGLRSRLGPGDQAAPMARLRTRY